MLGVEANLQTFGCHVAHLHPYSIVRRFFTDNQALLMRRVTDVGS
jgi:hypothetical protein